MSDPFWQTVMQAHQQDELDDLWEAVFENDGWGVTNALAMLHGMRDVVNAVNKKREGFALVHVAALHASPQVLAELLNAGAEPGAVGKERFTALHFALQAGKDGNAAVLIAAGASATAVASNGRGAAHFAAHSGKVALVGLLRQRARATLSAVDKEGNTPMHVAAELAKVGFIKALLGAGVDADAANSSGWTALHTAATKGYADVVRVLLDGGASANATNAAGWTPLHSAAKGGHAEVARALLQRGAHAGLRNKQGKLAQELAVDGEVRRMLKPPAESANPPAPRREAKTGGGEPGQSGKGSASGGTRPSPQAGVDGALSSWLARIGVADAVLPACGALGLASLADVRHVCEADLAQLGVPPVARRKFIEAAAEVPAQGALMQAAQQGRSRGEVGNRAAPTSTSFRPRPFPNYATVGAAAFDGHAEQLAAAYMRWLGFADAATNGSVHTPDQGIDVVARGAVAQVKANFRSAVKRPALAQLVGDASVPRYASCDLLFFAVSYGQDALDYAAQQTARPLSLFAFDAAGGVAAVNAHARQLAAGLTPSAAKAKPFAARGTAGFLPAAAFAGARPGYIFRTGERGTGYYTDLVSRGSSWDDD